MGRPLVLMMFLAVLQAPMAYAQSPEEIVRWIYASRLQPGPGGLAYLTAPPRRAQFMSRRMIAFLLANDSHGDDLRSACTDFAFDIPGNDFDAAEINRTLSISTQGDAERQSISARFSSFGQMAVITYDFIPEDGFWRIDDIAGPGWRVSRIPCAAATGAALPASTDPAVQGYCYKTPGDVFRFEVGADGQARFSLESWQGGGHFCGLSGSARPTASGWVHETAQGGQSCRIDIQITARQGLRLTDPGHRCKALYCGARAAIDGLTFLRESQLDCALLPPLEQN